jgi:hypothetical protein
LSDAESAVAPVLLNLSGAQNDFDGCGEELGIGWCSSGAA